MSLLVRPEKSTPVHEAAIAELFTKNDISSASISKETPIIFPFATVP